MSDPLPAADFDTATMEAARAAAGTSPGDGGGAPPARRSSRWLDRLTGLLLLGAISAVAVSVAPAALRPLRVDAAPRSSAARMPRVRYPGVPPTGRFSFDLSDDEPGAPPYGSRPLDPRGAPGDDEPGAAPEGLRMGLARKDLKIIGEPGADGVPVGEIKGGDMVMIVKEQGEWVLVLQNGADGVVMGWAPRREIAVR